MEIRDPDTYRVNIEREYGEQGWLRKGRHSHLMVMRWVLVGCDGKSRFLSKCIDKNENLVQSVLADYSCPKPMVSSTAIVSFCVNASMFLYGGKSNRLKLSRVSVCHCQSPMCIVPCMCFG